MSWATDLSPTTIFSPVSGARGMVYTGPWSSGAREGVPGVVQTGGTRRVLYRVLTQPGYIEAYLRNISLYSVHTAV